MNEDDRRTHNRWVHLMWQVLALAGILALLWVLGTQLP
jgi:hypothetical protein